MEPYLSNFFCSCVVTKRSENPDDQIKTWEEFQKQGKAETEMMISDLIEKADFKVDNSNLSLRKRTLFINVILILKLPAMPPL